ncbi:MAG TPA: M20/M25/M40 family metallo-hydrolase [Tepidisphaeraceae bacterium]|nr:M20/M25/M40 family metallo-hydrolase [Tepidisphaeraceae bacterium]
MDLLTALCATPTAPFAEQHVVAFVERFVADRPGLTLSRDRFGNLLVQVRTRGKRPRWVFTAHMDHPGLVAQRMTGPRTLRAAFRGGVLAEYVAGAKVRFFGGGRGVRGTIRDVTISTERGRPVPTAVEVEVRDPVAPGSPGMFDLEPAKLTKGGRVFQSRACDDLAGAAAALAMLDQLHRKPPESLVAVLLTRAEEEGFIGAIAAAKDGTLLRKSDRLVAVECSAEQPYAPIGGGCVVRVGDRTSVFDSAVSYFLTHTAEALAKRDESFKHQRALMPGGTCEATVYDLYGYTAGSVCVPLGNYHNMDKRRHRLAPEYIDTNDWQSMAKLFTAVARAGHTFDPANPQLRQRIEKRYARLGRLLHR